MKVLFASLIVTLALLCVAFDDEPECDAGEMRCNGLVSQMCSASEKWENYQDCGAIGDQCSTAPAQCSGYTGLACCF